MKDSMTYARSSTAIASGVLRCGTISLMVLLILATAVMLAGSFVALMATHRASATKQTVSQIATQTAMSGMLHAQHVLMDDFRLADAANIPQRFPDVYRPDPAHPQIFLNYGGRIPADRRGVDWKLKFDGSVGEAPYTYDMSSTGTVLYHMADNEYEYNTGAILSASDPTAADRFNSAVSPNSSYRIGTRWINTTTKKQFIAARVVGTGIWIPIANPDDSRPVAIDSMDARYLAMPMMYAPWRGSWHSMNSGSVNWGTRNGYDGFRGVIYGNAGAGTWPRWTTLNYLDSSFTPLPVAKRAEAAYETRVAVMALPLDGLLSINFKPNLLSRIDGGKFRFGSRKQTIPDGMGEAVGDVGEASAISSATSQFKDDAIAVQQGDKANLTFGLDSTVAVDVGTSYAAQAFRVETAWTGAGFPLAQQYATGLGNMLGAMALSDGGAVARIKKKSDLNYLGGTVTSHTNWAWSGAPPEYVKTTVNGVELRKATTGTGTLTKLVNILMGQGWRGNFYNYDLSGDPGDPWWKPSSPMMFQPGPNASWTQTHLKVGFEDTSVSENLSQMMYTFERIVDYTCFSLTPFGIGLETGRVPRRNRGGNATADIDCPWYLNVMMMDRNVAMGTICGLTSDWYSSFLQRNSRSGSGSSPGPYFPLNSANLLPIPPRKSCPLTGDAFAAVWNDGMARTGADGAEAGAIPPPAAIAGGSDYVLGTTYRRPPASSDEIGVYYFPADAFAGNAVFVWKNPVRDELVKVAETADVKGYFNAPYLSNNSANEVAYCFRGLGDGTATTSAAGRVRDKSTPRSGISGEDHLHTFVIGRYSNDSAMEAHAFYNRPKSSEDLLANNADDIDERLSYQNDINAALMKTLVDCYSDRTYGKRLAGNSFGYAKIEDVETVFLAHLGIAIRYLPAESKASTISMNRADYVVWLADPAVADGTWLLGKMNQLYALGRISSEIGADRSFGCTPSGTAKVNITTDACWGRKGFRNYIDKVNPDANGDYVTPGWPNVENPPGSKSYVTYRPTWAALSRIMEHRLNDVRMSIFGTPALDFNGDSIVDATTVSGSGEVSAGDAQLHFSSTGRWCIGQNQLWRVFVRAEVWDRKNDTIAEEAVMERVFILDPNGDGNMDDSHAIFNRWHGTPYKARRTGPTQQGRTEAFSLP